MYRRQLKLAETEALGQGRIHAIVSTEARDRDGDIVRAAGWDLQNFLKYPVLISSHEYGKLTNVIGEWEKMEIVGNSLQGTAKYYIGEGNAEADWGYRLAEKGRAAYSVGFIPDMEKAKQLDGSDGMWPRYEFKGQELLEVSHVTIPSNPEALQGMKSLDLPDPIASLVDAALGDVAEESEEAHQTEITAAATLSVSLDSASWQLLESLSASISGLNEALRNGYTESDNGKSRSLYNGFFNHSR